MIEWSLPEQSQNDTEADGRFRRRQAHDKQRHDLSHRRFRCQEAVEGHEVEIGSVQHQLDGNQHADQVPALEDAEQAQAEQSGRHDQVGAKAVHEVNLRVKPAVTIAPMMATSSTSEITSNTRS